MKKVFQTVVDKGNGNCMQAAIASLLELDLDQVPNFVKYQGDYSWVLYNFMKAFDYECCYVDKGTPKLQEIAKVDGGVNGFFCATVPSQTYKDVTHAVIVDSDMNIVHDPNPNQKALKLKPEDVIQILAVSNAWSIDVDGKIQTK